MTKIQLIEKLKVSENRINDLELSKNNYYSLLNNLPSIIAIINKNGSVVYINPSVEWNLGFKPDEIKKKNFIDLVHPDNVDEAKSIIKRVSKEQGYSSMFPEFRFKHKQGSWIYLEGDISNLFHNQAINGLVINLNDVTQMKLYEMDYTRLLEAVRISIDCFALSDNEYNIIFANESIVKLFGVENRSELIGRNISDLIMEEEIKNIFQSQSLEKGFIKKIEKGHIKSFEHTFVAQNESKIPVETSIARMKDRDNNQIGYVFITRDISERKRAEEELNKYRFHLEELVEERTTELNNSMKKFETALEGSIRAMALTVETRDPYTAGHQRRVAGLAYAISREMGLSEDMSDGIRMAGMIHDLGKIYVPSEILTKPGKLDDVEFLLIKKHPRVGYEILKSMEFPWPIAEIVYQHHEKLDGSGYPEGLNGDSIIIGARIITVADVVEAMASLRPYREGLGLNKALDEIKRYRGIHYDPDAVDACLRLFREKNFTFD